MNQKKIIAIAGGVGGVVALFVGAQLVASRMATKEVDKAIASVSDLVEVDYKRVNASLLGGGTQVKDVTLSPVGSGEQYQIDEIVVYDYKATENDIPTRINMAINGMALDVGAMGESASSLKEYGYGDALSVNFSTQYTYQEAEKEVRLEKFKMGADEVGDLDVSVHLSNIVFDPATVAAMPFSLFGTVFHEATITYDDDSLVTRMFDTAAATAGVSVADLKKEAIASLEKDLASGDKSLSQELVAEMKNFINNPDGFTVSINPDEPVPFSALLGTGGDPDKLIELLNVRFES